MTTLQRRARPPAGEKPSNLVKMSELARRSEVPAATIKHYIREGLLPAPSLRTSRNMAYYDAGLVPRIRAIKEVQRTQHLPLRLIKEAIDERPAPAGDDLVARCLARSLERLARSERRTRTQLLEGGMPADQLAYFEGLGILSPSPDAEGEAVYQGDDLELLRTLGAARRAGISPDMLPHTILEPYVRAIGQLVRVELSLLRSGIVPRSAENLPEVVEQAARLSEQLILLLRRKMILPMLAELQGESRSPSTVVGAGTTAAAARSSTPRRNRPRGATEIKSRRPR